MNSLEIRVGVLEVSIRVVVGRVQSNSLQLLHNTMDEIVLHRNYLAVRQNDNTFPLNIPMINSAKQKRKSHNKTVKNCAVVPAR